MSSEAIDNVYQFPREKTGRLVATPSPELAERIEAFANKDARQKLGSTGIHLHSQHYDILDKNDAVQASGDPAPGYSPDFHRKLGNNTQSSRQLLRYVTVANDREYRFLRLGFYANGNDLRGVLQSTPFTDDDAPNAIPLYTTFEREDLASGIELGKAVGKLATFVLGEASMPADIEQESPSRGASVTNLHYGLRNGAPRFIQ